MLKKDKKVLKRDNKSLKKDNKVLKKGKKWVWFDYNAVGEMFRWRANGGNCLNW